MRKVQTKRALRVAAAVIGNISLVPVGRLREDGEQERRQHNDHESRSNRHHARFIAWKKAAITKGHRPLPTGQSRADLGRVFFPHGGGRVALWKPWSELSPHVEVDRLSANPSVATAVDLSNRLKQIKEIRQRL